jgi:hypothetical protein
MDTDDPFADDLGLQSGKQTISWTPNGMPQKTFSGQQTHAARMFFQEGMQPALSKRSIQPQVSEASSSTSESIKNGAIC